MDHDDVAAPRRPFALDAYERRSKVEDDVRSFVAERMENTEAELQRRVGDRRLSGRALLVRRQLHAANGTVAVGRTVS